MRRSIPPGCVARRLNSLLFALLAPFHAGASTHENVKLFLREPSGVQRFRVRFFHREGAKNAKVVSFFVFRNEAGKQITTGLLQAQGQLAKVPCCFFLGPEVSEDPFDLVVFEVQSRGYIIKVYVIVKCI